MKEILAIIRSQKVNATKDALAKAGFPGFFACKVLGRGKRHIAELAMLSKAIQDGSIAEGEELPRSMLGESLSERNRLISKRLFCIIANDEDVQTIIQVIIAANQTNTPGDGRIFVLPISSTYRVRDKALLTKAS